MNSFFWKNQSRLSKNGQKNNPDPVKKTHVVGILATIAVASTAGGAAGAGKQQELMPWEIAANRLADRMADAKRAVAEPEKEKGKHHRHSPEKLKLRREYQDVMDQKK